VHRVSQRGNRTLHHALHLAAMMELRQHHSDGRTYTSDASWWSSEFDRASAVGRRRHP